MPLKSAQDRRQGRGRRGREAAEELAIAALGFIAADPERLSDFLALSGLDVAHLRAAARDDGFLAGLMAHLAADEGLLLAFAAAQGLAPEEVAAACQALNPDFEA